MHADEERSLAIALFNGCWEILDAGDTSEDAMIRLLTNAFASKYHWANVGEHEQWIISDWMVARAASTAGYGDLAVFFAKRANELAQSFDSPDWLRASVAEGLARAYDAAGDLDTREQWRERASELVGLIRDDEDRQLISDQLASVPR